jgi:kynureninase
VVSTDPHPALLPVSRLRSADAWSVNPPIFSMSRASLEIFDAVGMDAIRSRSLRLTGYLRALLMTIADRCDMAIVTPEADDRHGAQLSVRVSTDVGDLVERMSSNWGVVADDRRPDIVRFAPASLYCTFHDCWRAADALSQELTGEGIA